MSHAVATFRGCRLKNYKTFFMAKILFIIQSTRKSTDFLTSLSKKVTFCKESPGAKHKITATADILTHLCTALGKL